MRKVLRQDFHLSYRKVKQVAFQGNSERCLVSRMLYARQMFDLLDSGKRIINVDETWLPTLDFRGKKWRRRGCDPTVSSK